MQWSPPDKTAINDEVKPTLRKAGFIALLAFSLLIIVIVIYASPENIAIALFYGFFWLGLACLALIRNEHAELCAKLWAALSLPMYPVIVLLNGLLPASLIPVAVIFPVILLTGWWRLVAVFTVASCSFLVPFHGGDYDQGLWLRMSLSNVIVSVLIYLLVSSLENALRKSQSISDELRRALEAERQASSAKATFLATMSHEIRTPMNGVLGLTESMLSQSLSEQQRPMLQKIHRSGELLNRILNDILDLSKLDADKLVVEPKVFDLHELLSECGEFYSESARKNGVVIHTHIRENVPHRVCADRVRIAQILNNLLSNAIKFTQQGEITLSAEKGETADDGSTMVRFCVSDTGSGIDPSLHAHIFDAFTQVHSSVDRKHGGTGLGLQIVKRLVEKMHGEIWLESALGRGSAFYFELPLCIDDSNEHADMSPQPLPHTYSGTVLIVEDNEINQLVASAILSEFGVAVDVANDGKQALSKVLSHHYDLILMDINMPVMDGRAATRHIRREGISTPIVALTAAVLQEEVDLALEAGMDGFLAKPIVRDDLQATLERYLTTI